jgi:hypothetical protein
MAPTRTSVSSSLHHAHLSARCTEVNKGRRNHGLPKGVTRRPNSHKLECKVHMDGKRFYVGLFNTVEEALEAQTMRKRKILEAAENDPHRLELMAGRTMTGEEEIEKVRLAQAEGAALDKVRDTLFELAATLFLAC